MNFFQSLMILVATLLAVFGQAMFAAPRLWLGAQIDLLPVLTLYAALYAGLPTLALVALLGGVAMDVLSANPPGVTVLPLFLAGWPVHWRRDLILRDSPFAQFVMGALVSAVVPGLVLLMLLSGGRVPPLGWASLWQWLVMAAGGGVAAPLVFALLNYGRRALGHQERQESSFRPDREIRHGRILR